MAVVLGLSVSVGCSDDSSEAPPATGLADADPTAFDSDVDAFEGNEPPHDLGPGPCGEALCFHCTDGSICAAGDAPPPEGTCCALGDSLAHRGQGPAPEAVDVVSDGTWAVLCGGFGASIYDVTDPTEPIDYAGASARCQHAALVDTPDGELPVVIVSHHGDTWVEESFLAAYALLPEGGSELLGQISEPGIFYEGIVERDGLVYAAAHDRGLRVYDFSNPNAPVFVSELTEFTNAWRLLLRDDLLFVADYGEGISVLSLADPLAPVRMTTVETAGPPRDVAASGERLFVAMGGFGVAAYDLAQPTAPSLVGSIETSGTAQRVDANERIVAVAAWSHVALYDAETLELVATEKLAQFPDFEQDLAVDVVGDWVFVAEWNNLHALEHEPQFTGPDLWLDESFYTFEAGGVGVRTVVVHNRGSIPLQVTNVMTNSEAFQVSRTTFAVAPGGQEFFEVTYTPGVAYDQAFLILLTNDPDPLDAVYKTGLIVEDSDLLNVGDTLTQEFSFLDPNGAFELEALKGRVTVLAYFALF